VGTDDIFDGVHILFLTRIVRTGFPRIGDISPLVALETRGNPQAEARITRLKAVH
jgi:hypothetical protein